MRGPLLYYITDGTQFDGDENTRRAALLARIRDAAQSGVDYIQLRERGLNAHELESLAEEAASCVTGTKTKLLINHRSDVAIAVGAAGVHLRSRDEVAPSAARAIFQKAGVADPLIAVSCHSPEEAIAAEACGVDFIVFGPVFGKKNMPGAGVEALRAVCAKAKVPVLALGGVDLENAQDCARAGAAGVAGIRLFQGGDVAVTVAALRALA